MKRITILLADDNTLVRWGLRQLLELDPDLEVVGEAKNGREVVAMAKRWQPALVLMDVAMPLLSGLQATRQMRKAAPATKVIILSGHSDEAYVVEAMNAGAMGYLLKQSVGDNLCHAIRAVQKGKSVFSPAIPRRLAKRKWT